MPYKTTRKHTNFPLKNPLKDRQLQTFSNILCLTI
jgi:hypothetical protein